MRAQIKTIMALICVLTLCSCASNPNVTETTSKQSTSSEVQDLSEYQSTEIETSNGTLQIEPTVVATTDRAVTTNDSPLYYDPLEAINRPIFHFNHYAYKYALIPAAKGYNAVVPKPVQKSVSNVFSNIVEPLNLINNTLSGEFSEAGANLGRFLINSTVGLLGVFDPATAWFEIEEKPQAFSQTLSKYGVGSGAYLVLPFLGQSDVRGASSIVTESLVHPTKYVLNAPKDAAARVIDGFHDFSSQAEIYEVLHENAQDPYSYFRNQYIQSRNRDDIAKKEQSEVNVAPQSASSEQENE